MRLTEDQIVDIYTNEEPHSDLAARYGVAVNTVMSIRHGKTHTWLTQSLTAPIRYRRKAKLSADQVEEIRGSSESLSTLAKRYRISPSMVSRIKNRLRRNDI